MSRLQIPRLPGARPEYDQGHMSDMIRAIEQAFGIILTPGEGRNTFTVFTNLPTSDQALEIGATFSVDGALRVAINGAAYPPGNAMTMSEGTVTVTTV